MKQLSAADARYLYMETDTTVGHGSGLFVYERPTEDFDPVQAVRDRYLHVVNELPPLRRRLVEVPFSLDHPYWIADPSFDLDYHIRAAGVPKPGRIDQLTDLVGWLITGPMDRTRPLWEVYVIDGLANGNWALLFLTHHALVDGAAAMLILNALHDTDRDAPPPPPAPPWSSEPVPSEAEMLARAYANLGTNPQKAMQATARLYNEMAERSGRQQVPPDPDEESEQLPGAYSNLADSAPASSAPWTPWNKMVSKHRRVALAQTSLENIKRLKNATGATVNDIVLAICAGALREYLLAHDALPDEPLRALVPISIRTADDEDPWTNLVSGIVADLPTDSDDPLERIARCKAAMLEAKSKHELVPVRALADVEQFSPPTLLSATSRLVSELRLADHVQPMVNLVISNIPGSRQPFYLSGAQMLHHFPVGMATDGLGMNITVLSYLDELNFGFVADRELVPDAWFLADLHVAEVSRLFDATGAEWATPPQPSLGPPGATK